MHTSQKGHVISSLRSTSAATLVQSQERNVLTAFLQNLLSKMSVSSLEEIDVGDEHLVLEMIYSADRSTSVFIETP